MRYPDTINLPFNAAILAGEFVRGAPGDAVPDQGSAFVIVQGNNLVVEQDEDGLRLPRRLPDHWLCRDREPIFLGSWQGRPLFALRIGKDDVLEPPFSAEPFNAVEDRLDVRLLSIGGLANQALHWDAASCRCGRCGGASAWIGGSWGKRCTGCGYEWFPAIYPCAIVLVKRGDEFLLINKPEWLPGRYSLVAGFLDFGESLEECAVREVKEETGIIVKELKYIGSQSWPFPSQLMAGFVAEYAGGEIVVDRSEIADAQWFSRDRLPETFPPHRSIARWIIEKHAISCSACFSH